MAKAAAHAPIIGRVHPVIGAIAKAKSNPWPKAKAKAQAKQRPIAAQLHQAHLRAHELDRQLQAAQQELADVKRQAEEELLGKTQEIRNTQEILASTRALLQGTRQEVVVLCDKRILVSHVHPINQGVSHCAYGASLVPSAEVASYYQSHSSR